MNKKQAEGYAAVMRGMSEPKEGGPMTMTALCIVTKKGRRVHIENDEWQALSERQIERLRKGGYSVVVKHYPIPPFESVFKKYYFPDGG